MSENAMNPYTAPKWSKSALITIDTQCDTLNGQPFSIPGTTEMLPRMEKLLQTFRKTGKPIIHVVRLYRPDGSNADLCRKMMLKQGAQLLLTGSPGSQLVPELLPKKGIQLDVDKLVSGGIQVLGTREWVIYKPRWGAFYKTPLARHLTDMNVSTLVFAGCNFPNCPRTSIYEAGERDFRVVLVEDAISGLYERGRVEMQNIGVAVLNTKQVVNAMLNDNRKQA
jgi:nicotinamidase-related amidase